MLLQQLHDLNWAASEDISKASIGQNAAIGALVTCVCLSFLFVLMYLY